MRTWETGDRLWLRDFLPKDLRTARIFTFGYDSGTAFTDSKSRISDFATQLLEKLVQLQRRTKDTKVSLVPKTASERSGWVLTAT